MSSRLKAFLNLCWFESSLEDICVSARNKKLSFDITLLYEKTISDYAKGQTQAAPQTVLKALMRNFLSLTTAKEGYGKCLARLEEDPRFQKAFPKEWDAFNVILDSFRDQAKTPAHIETTLNMAREGSDGAASALSYQRPSEKPSLKPGPSQRCDSLA